MRVAPAFPARAAGTAVLLVSWFVSPTQALSGTSSRRAGRASSVDAARSQVIAPGFMPTLADWSLFGAFADRRCTRACLVAAGLSPAFAAPCAPHPRAVVRREAHCLCLVKDRCCLQPGGTRPAQPPVLRLGRSCRIRCPPKRVLPVACCDG